jgi:hypothetical protein
VLVHVATKQREKVSANELATLRFFLVKFGKLLSTTKLSFNINDTTYYNSATNTINFGLDTNRLIVSDLLHETAHAALYKAMEDVIQGRNSEPQLVAAVKGIKRIYDEVLDGLTPTQKKAVQRMKKIVEELRGELTKEQEDKLWKEHYALTDSAFAGEGLVAYGLTDLHEFTSVMMESKKFRQFVNTLDLQPRAIDIISRWWNRILQLLGVAPGSKVDQVLRHIADIADELKKTTEGEQTRKEQTATSEKPTTFKLNTTPEDNLWFTTTLSKELEKDRPLGIAPSKDGTPKDDITGLIYDLGEFAKKSVEEGKMTLTKKYYAPPAVRAAVRAVQPLKIGDVYSEPLIDRLERLGGPVSKQVAKEARQIASRAKRYYGELTPTLDYAKELAGRAYRGGSTWIQGLEKVTDFAATSRMVGAIEGTLAAPNKAKELVAELKKANLAIGKLAEKAVEGFHARGLVQRNLTVLGYDVVRRGPGDQLWQRFAAGVAKANGKPVSDVEDILVKWKAALDRGGYDTAALNRIAQDFIRYFPKTVTHVKLHGIWHELVHSSPFHYLENAAQRTAHAVAFREVYKPDSGLLKETRQNVQRELQTPRHGREFDNLMLALQGHPLEALHGWWTAKDMPIGMVSAAADAAVPVIKSMMLSANALVNLGETLVGAPVVFLGLDNVLRQVNSVGIYELLEMAGAVNKALYDLSFNPNAPLRSIGRQLSTGIRKYTGQQYLNELQELMAAVGAHVLVERLKSKDATPYMRQRAKAVARAMGFPTVEAEAIANATDEELLKQFVTRAAPWLTGGNVGVAERSRLGASRLFNNFFWFHIYPQTRLNQMRGVVNNLIDDIRNKNFEQGKHDAILAGRLFGGLALQGAITTVIAGLLTGLSGPGQRWREAEEEPLEFLKECIAASLSGPVYLVWRTMKTPETWRRNLAWAVTPMALASELTDASMGLGKYEGLSPGERALEFARNKSPGFGFVKTLMALWGLANTEEQDFDTAVRAFYRWRRETLGSKATEMHLREDVHRPIRVAAKRVIRAVQNGGDVEKELRKVLEVTTEEELYRSLKARTILKTPEGGKLSEEQEKTIRKRLGNKLYSLLQRYDEGVGHIADYFEEQRSQEMFGKEKEQLAPRERLAVEAARPKEVRADTVMERQLNDTSRQILKRYGLSVPYTSETVSLKGQTLRLTLEEERLLNSALVASYNEMLLHFHKSDKEKTQEVLDAWLAAARQKARAKVIQRIVANRE